MAQVDSIEEENNKKDYTSGENFFGVAIGQKKEQEEKRREEELQSQKLRISELVKSIMTRVRSGNFGDEFSLHDNITEDELRQIISEIDERIQNTASAKEAQRLEFINQILARAHGLSYFQLINLISKANERLNSVNFNEMDIVDITNEIDGLIEEFNYSEGLEEDFIEEFMEPELQERVDVQDEEDKRFDDHILEIEARKKKRAEAEIKYAQAEAKDLAIMEEEGRAMDRLRLLQQKFEDIKDKYGKGNVKPKIVVENDVTQDVLADEDPEILESKINDSYDRLEELRKKFYQIKSGNKVDTQEVVAETSPSQDSSIDEQVSDISPSMEFELEVPEVPQIIDDANHHVEHGKMMKRLMEELKDKFSRMENENEEGSQIKYVAKEDKYEEGPETIATTVSDEVVEDEAEEESENIADFLNRIKEARPESSQDLGDEGLMADLQKLDAGVANLKVDPDEIAILEETDPEVQAPDLPEQAKPMIENPSIADFKARLAKLTQKIATPEKEQTPTQESESPKSPDLTSQTPSPSPFSLLGSEKMQNGEGITGTPRTSALDPNLADRLAKLGIGRG